ncbi:MAG: hypothetical protein ACSHYB_16635 [Roseibacillus sp.]
MKISATQTQTRKKTATFESYQGFSLIVTVTMMVLLALIAIGLLGLSSTVLRSSQSDNDMLKARANARLGLQIAIGELQRTMGPDTRVSANAAILDNQGTVREGMKHIAGAWNAWQQDPANIGDYSQRKSGVPSENEDPDNSNLTQPNGGFYRWLVSTENELEASEVGFATRAAQSSQVTLVPNKGGTDSTLVKADRVPLRQPDGKTSGQFAWAVLDEGQKAAGNGIAPENNEYSELEVLASQSEIAWGNVKEWSTLADLTPDERRKLISLDTMTLGGVPQALRFSHDLAPYASSVLSDTALGGLRTDLSQLLGQRDLPEEYENRHVYSDAETPLMEAAARDRHRYLWPSPDPMWHLMHKFHRIPEDVFGGETENPKVNFKVSTLRSREPNTMPNRPNGFDRRAPDPTDKDSYHNSLKLAPVISKAQFIFSLTFASGSGLRNGSTGYWARDGGKNQSDWDAQALMIIDPVITLWNPYDVPLEVSSFRVFLYRIPITFLFESDNPRITNPTEYTEFVMAIAPSANKEETFAYPLRILPESGEGSFELLPGEHRVFSAQDYQSSWAIGLAKNEGKAIQMRPGWYPPGSGRRDAIKVGGISTENLFRDDSGVPSAKYKDKRGTPHGTAGLPVEDADNIRISVRPSESEIGRFVTAGNQAVDFYLRYGSDAADSQILAGSEQQAIPDFGAIELDYGERITEILEAYQADRDIPTFPIEPRDISTAPIDTGHTAVDRRTGQISGTVMKKPFLVATLHLKSLVDEAYRSKFPSKAWIHNNPAAIYAAAGTGNQLEDLAAQQYEFSYQPVQGDWLNGGFPELSPGERHQGFGGPSPGVDSGRVFAPFTSLPRAAPTSLAQFRHAPLNSSGKQPLQAQVLANSFAHPLLAPDQVVDETLGYLDHSFLANQALFDSTFFSGAPASVDFGQFLKGEIAPLNPRLRSLASDVEANSFSTVDKPYEEAASYLLQDGAFNVNSTSVRAWQAFLTAMNQESIPVLSDLSEPGLGTIDNEAKSPTTSRYLTPIEQTLGSNLDEFGGEEERPAWTGHRQLTNEQIETLAANIVEEVKKRGPFQSLSEFVNRRAEDSELGTTGALQAAIDNAGINTEVLTDDGKTIEEDSEAGQGDYQNLEAATGSSLAGTPGFLTQGDLLHALAPSLTARSDTFRIRSYGSSTDPQGRVTAEAWCEATVQRYPEYIDSNSNEPADHPTRGDSSPPLSEVNERFGRRFRVVSFRWIGSEEVVSS